MPKILSRGTDNVRQVALFHVTNQGSIATMNLKKALQKVFGKAMQRPNKILCRSNLLVVGIQNFGEGSSARPKPLIDRNFQDYAKPSIVHFIRARCLVVLQIGRQFFLWINDDYPEKAIPNVFSYLQCLFPRSFFFYPLKPPLD